MGALEYCSSLPAALGEEISCCFFFPLRRLCYLWSYSSRSWSATGSMHARLGSNIVVVSCVAFFHNSHLRAVRRTLPVFFWLLDMYKQGTAVRQVVKATRTHLPHFPGPRWKRARKLHDDDDDDHHHHQSKALVCSHNRQENRFFKVLPPP